MKDFIGLSLLLGGYGVFMFVLNGTGLYSGIGMMLAGGLIILKE